MNEIKNMIQEMVSGFEKFKGNSDTRFKNLESALAAIETALGRRNFGGGGSVSAGLSADAQEHAKQFLSWVRKGDIGNLRDLEIKAALSTDSDPDGGFLVTEEMDKEIDRVMLAASAMRRIARVRNISKGTYKKLVSQGGTESGWVGEKDSRDDTDTPTLAEIAINAMELYANPKATQTLLDDADYDAAGWLTEEISDAFTEQEGTAFITGTGVLKPKGILAYATVANANYVWGKLGYIVSGHASLLNNADKLIDLQHALKPALRQGAVWLMNDTTLSVVRKFKDGNGDYLWRQGLSDNSPDTILGKPVEVDDNMPDIGAGAYPIAFGNFKRGYTIVDRIGIRLLRDPYTNKPYVQFYTTKRVGGGVTHYEAIKLMKISA